MITGIRRCGKSSLLKLMALHLKESGVSAEQIIEINFESHKFQTMSADDFYHYIALKIIPGKRMYLFMIYKVYRETLILKLLRSAS